MRVTKCQLSEGDRLPLEKLLFEYHNVFSLEDEQEETSMIKFEINKGNELSINKLQGEYHIMLVKKCLIVRKNAKDWCH